MADAVKFMYDMRSRPSVRHGANLLWSVIEMSADAAVYQQRLSHVFQIVQERLGRREVGKGQEEMSITAPTPPPPRQQILTTPPPRLLRRDAVPDEALCRSLQCGDD